MTCSLQRDPAEEIDPTKVRSICVFTEEDAARARGQYPNAKVTVLPLPDLGEFPPMYFQDMDTGELLQHMIDNPNRYRALSDALRN